MVVFLDISKNASLFDQAICGCLTLWLFWCCIAPAGIQFLVDIEQVQNTNNPNKSHTPNNPYKLNFFQILLSITTLTPELKNGHNYQ